jgi:hypothetical protein
VEESELVRDISEKSDQHSLMDECLKDESTGMTDTDDRPV